METEFCSPESVPQDCVERLLTELAASDPAKFALFSGQLRGKFPDEVLRAWVSHIAATAPDSSTEHALQCASNPKYFPLLLDPAFLPLDKAIRAALLLRDSDPRFFAKLSALDGNNQNLGRALDILEGFGEYSVLFSWLRILTNHEDDRIKSKAVKLFCKLRNNNLLVERQLKSSDSRVRANAIEALWFDKSPEATVIFRHALSDSANRVVVNALIGLYYQNDEGAMQTLSIVSKHPSETFRLAVAWAYGFLADPRAIPALESLLEDDSKAVRERAAKALARVTTERVVA